MKKILVTGGTGLIGSHLIEGLVERGHSPCDIKALVRPSSDTRFLAELGVQLCYGDVLVAESLKAAMKDVEVIFHCAAQVGNQQHLTPKAMRQANWRINFNGTEHLLEAARSAQVERFIHVSTIGIYLLLGQDASAKLAAEKNVREHPSPQGLKATLIRPPVTYISSKLAAEQKVWEYFNTYGLKTVVIRPTLTLGERDRAVTQFLMKLARRKVIPVINGGRGLVPFVHAKDVARALVLASQSEQAVGQSYDVEGFSVTMKEGIEFFVNALGSKAKVLNVPSQAAYLGALLAECLLAIAERSLYPIMAGNMVRLVRVMATEGLTFDTTKLRRELGFEPRYGMEESFRQAIRWQLEQEG